MGLAFPYTYDVMRSVTNKVNQPVERPGMPSWGDEEWSQALNKAYAQTSREISTMDRQFYETKTQVMIPSGTISYTLPTRTMDIRLAMVVDSSGHQRRLIRRAVPEETGLWAYGESARYYPDSNTLVFSERTKSQLTVILWTGAYYIPLIHGPVLTAGGNTAQLSDWESIESGLYVGASGIVSRGTGAGQTFDVTAYNGATKTITVAVAWTTVLDDTSELSTRPDLPWEAKDMFENYVVAALYEKTDERSSQKFTQLAMVALDRMKAAVAIKERREPDQTYDQNQNGGWGDPAAFFTY